MELSNPEILKSEMLNVALVIYAIRLILWILYAKSIVDTIALIKVENRMISAKMGWLVAVPIVNIYYNFVCTRALSDSLTNEFYDRKIAEEENPGRKAGITYAWFFLLAWVPMFPSFLVLTFGILSLVYFVGHWMKVVHFKHIIEAHNQFLDQQPTEDHHDIIR